MKSRVSIRHAMGPKFLLLYERERERGNISSTQQFTGRICRARAFTTAKWLARSRFRLISVAQPDVSSSATRYDHEENRSSIFRSRYHRRYRAAEVFTVLLSRPTLLTFLPLRLSLALHLYLALRRVRGPTTAILKVWPWRDKKSPPRCLKARGTFPSSLRSFSPSRSNQASLHFFNQSFPPLSLLIAFILSPFPSLSLSLSSLGSHPFLPDSLHHSAGSSVFVEVYVSVSLAPISPAARLPRSYESLVSLVISSYGRLCVSLRFLRRVLFVRAYISRAQILWKVSVLFVLALWVVCLCLRRSWLAHARSVSLPLVSAISGQTQAGLGYIYAKGPV